MTWKEWSCLRRLDLSLDDRPGRYGRYLLIEQCRRELAEHAITTALLEQIRFGGCWAGAGGYARRYLPAHAEPAGLLPDLIITTSATAMTGDEYAVTGELMNEHVLPLLRRHRVRFMQIARAGQPDAAGHVVLVDSRAPARTHLRGPWALSDELAATGTVPQLAARRRICSYRANPVPG